MSESLTLHAGNSGRTISVAAWRKLSKSAFGSSIKHVCDPDETRRLMAECEHLLKSRKGAVGTSWRILTDEERTDIGAALKWLLELHAKGPHRGYSLSVVGPQTAGSATAEPVRQKPPTKFYAMKAYGDATKPRVPTIEAPDEYGRILAKRLGRASGRLDDAIGHAGRGELRRVLLADPALGREAWREVGEKLLTMVRVSEVRVEQF